MYVDVGIEIWPTRAIAWRSEFIQEIRRDLVFYTIIAYYFIVMLCLSELFDRHYWLTATVIYLTSFASIATLGFLASFGPRLVHHFIRTRPDSPLKAAATLLGAWARPARIAGFFLYLSLAVFMGAFTTVKTMLPDMQGFWFDPVVSKFGAVLHGGVDPWRLLSPFLGLHTVTRAIEVLYSPGWLLVTAGFPLLMAAFTADRVLRDRFLLAFLAAWILNGTILAGIFMSGGPAFYQGITGDGSRYRGLIRYLAFDRASPISAAREQADLWSSYLARRSGVGAGISAFPSMHVTMATLVACAGWRIDRRIGIALSIFTAVIVIGSVHLGWHYAVDGYFALLSSLALWWLAGRLLRRLHAPPPPARAFT